MKNAVNAISLFLGVKESLVFFGDAQVILIAKKFIKISKESLILKRMNIVAPNVRQAICSRDPVKKESSGDVVIIQLVKLLSVINVDNLKIGEEIMINTGITKKFDWESFWNNSKLKLILTLVLAVAFTMPSMFFEEIFHFSLFEIINIFQFVLAITFGEYSILILPTMFIILSLFYAKKWYPVFLSILSGITAILSAIWICISLSHGIEYQGMSWVLFICLLDIGLFSGIFYLIKLSNKYKKKHYLYFATLIFFITLSLVAFPWFGEYI